MRHRCYLPTASQKIRETLGKAMELVAKLYWPEASRVGEGEIIEKARQIAEQNKVVSRVEDGAELEGEAV